MRRPWSGDDSLLTRLTDNPRARFRAWRQPRPVFGGLLLIIGGLLIGYVPLQFASELMLIGGAFTVIGLLFAALVAFCGIAVLAKPRLSTIFGVFGVAFSTLSLFGALGGLFIGMIVGTIGGVLSYSWEPPEGYEYDEPAFTFQRTGFIWQEASEFIWHAGPEVEPAGESGDASDAVADGSHSDETVATDSEPSLGDGAASETATADDGSPVERPSETSPHEWGSPGDDGWESPTGDQWGAPTADANEASRDGPTSRASEDAADAPDVESAEATADADESETDGTEADEADGTEAEFDWENEDDEDDDIDWDETDVVDDRFEL